MDSLDATPAALSRDARFDLLRSGRRRAVLRRLDDADGPVPLAELVAAAVSREAEAAFTPGQHERVTVGLEHVHLPKLEEAGVVEYDDVERTARLLDGHDLLFEHLYLADGR